MAWLRQSVGEYLIISPGSLVHGVGQLIEQKRQRGYEVKVKLLETFADPLVPKHEQIRRFVLNNPPDFLLLVGDLDRMPAYPIILSGETFQSDNYFSMEDGDHFPKVPTGRLSSSDFNTLSNICSRLIAYPADASADWRRRVILTGWVPRAPDTPNADWTQDATYQCMEHIGAYYDVSMQFEYDPNYWCLTDKGREIWKVGSHTSKSALTQSIEEGVVIVRYLGHGDIDAWGNVGQTNETFYVSDVRRLNVGSRLPFVISAACKTGQIRQNPSLAEAFLTEGKAIGVFAADINSATLYADRITQRIFEQIVTAQNRRIGEAIVGAMKAVHDRHRGEAGIDDGPKYYRLIGDPDTVLAAPEDVGNIDSRRCIIHFENQRGKSVHTQSIDFGKRVRRAYPVLNGWELKFTQGGVHGSEQMINLMGTRAHDLPIVGSKVDLSVEVKLDDDNSNKPYSGYVDAMVFALVDD